MIPAAYASVRIDQTSVNPIAKFNSIGSILNLLLPTIMIVASLVFLAILLYGAFSYVTSSGEQDKVQKARKTITYSVLGLVLILFSYLIVSLVGVVTGTGLPF